MTLLESESAVVPTAGPAVVDLGAGSGPGWLDAWLARHRSEVVAWRRALHATPELGRAERGTTAFVAHLLTAAGLEPRTLPGGTGLVCDVGRGSRCVALRADIDALPLHEATGLPFASTVPNVMHACGHDAHTAMLLGAGLALATAPSLPGRVRLIFQPAEEIQPGGALDMVADGATRRRRPDLRAALRPAPGGRPARHPGRPDHLGVRRAGDLRLASPGGHTARPHLTADLVYALGLLITQLPLLLTRHVDPRSGDRPGLGGGAGRRGAERDPAARRAARHPAHGRPRDLGRRWSTRSARSSSTCSRPPARPTRSRTPAASRRW